MFKKICGVPNWETKETRQQVTQAQSNYKDYMLQLQGTKKVYRNLKNSHALERKRIEREARIAEMFKFKGMKKRIDFLPALSPRENGFEKITGLAIGDKYIAHKDKSKLCYPDRASEKFTSDWKLGSRVGNTFKKEVGQELDDFDIDYRKYMQAHERGVDLPPSMLKLKRNTTIEPAGDTSPFKGSLRNIENQSLLTLNSPEIGSPEVTRLRNNSVQPSRNKIWDTLDNSRSNEQSPEISRDQSPGRESNKTQKPRVKSVMPERYIATCKFKWTPNNFLPEIIGYVQPPLERNNTPRTIRKQITLERTFDRDIWMHSKNHLQSFTGSDITNDVARGKLLKRIRKRKLQRDKAEKSAMEAQQTGAKLLGILSKTPTGIRFNKQLQEDNEIDGI